MAEIGVRDLKIRASEIVRTVREEQARYVVTYRGHPVGMLLPIDQASGAVGADTASAEAAWGELMRLGEAIGREWQSPMTSVELLSEMRR